VDGTGVSVTDRGITVPLGFRAAGIHSGIKRRRADLAIVASDFPCAVAGVFTTNRVKAAPVRYSLEVVGRGQAQAIVANSGNANACTGAQGQRDAAEMARLAAEALAIRPQEVLVASTGIIGQPLPMEALRTGIPRACAQLERAGAPAAEAILTTDSGPKTASTTLEVGGSELRIGGMAKGAGMIHPRLATTLCFLTTDATVSPDRLDAVLRGAVARSFNRITVDGDTSTNDCILILANGAAGGDPITGGAALGRFEASLHEVTSDLAEQIVRDGEGATKVVEIRVTGAASDADAERVAYRLANSLLVKTALHGAEPNWGRMMAALGSAHAEVSEDLVQIHIGSAHVVRNGLGVADSLSAATAELLGTEVDLHIELGLGEGEAAVLTCDLSEEYVRINGSYAAESGVVS
jgi:glutamate N-acetyltransferase/amino-acid N-acetyltransferase